jgi:hypothetical protein
MGAAPAYKRTEIMVETDHVTTIRRRRSLQVWCRTCGRMVDSVGIEEAGALAGVKQTQLRDKLRDKTGAEGWHVCEGWDGEMLICLDSLLKSL